MWSEGHHAETVCRQDIVLLAQPASITHLRDEEQSKVQVHIDICPCWIMTMHTTRCRRNCHLCCTQQGLHGMARSFY